MTDAVFDFKAIARKLNRQEQKAEFDAKESATVQAMYGWPYGAAANGSTAVPFNDLNPSAINTDWLTVKI